ncbi:MAG: hypothetical protein NVSMB32_16990 [Actinomycetota bacterium]
MSPAITPTDSAKEAHAISEAIDEAAKRQDWPAVVAACRQALEHPCARHAFYVADIWTGLAEAYAIQKDYDAAIVALQSAVAAGHRAWPHPDADVARLHLLAGRRAEADALFASLRGRTPEDIWLYQSAGAGYADAADHAVAVEWLSAGIELGLRTGDPDGLVGDLAAARNASLIKLGKTADALSTQAQEFVATWVRPAPGTWSPPEWPEEPGDVGEASHGAGADASPGTDATSESGAASETEAQPCEHCGWVPLTMDPADVARRRDPRGDKVPMGVAFFTADEWPRAVASWPDLLAEMPADHFAYVREMQSRILQISEATGARLIMVPMSVGGLVGFCETNQKLNAGSGQARAEYAASLVQQGYGRPWPPARNEPCWCGSARKYKVCCGTVDSPAPLHSV